VTSTDTEEQRESAYVSRKRMWRAPLEPSSLCTKLLYRASIVESSYTEPLYVEIYIDPYIKPYIKPLYIEPLYNIIIFN
jgi:hypothetical protein